MRGSGPEDKRKPWERPELTSEERSQLKAIGEENRERWQAAAFMRPNLALGAFGKALCDRQIDVRLVLDCGAGRSIPGALHKALRADAH